VLHWMTEQPATNLFTTTITQAEIFVGLTLLPEQPGHGLRAG
jgi:hypothetical protein